MDFTKKSIKTNFLTPDEIQISLDKGHEFENYVANLFKLKKDYFAISEWTTDHSDKRTGIIVESDSKPDFVIRYKPRMKLSRLNVNGEQIYSTIIKFKIMLSNGRNLIRLNIINNIPNK